MDDGSVNSWETKYELPGLLLRPAKGDWQVEFLGSIWNWYWSGAQIPLTTSNPIGADPITTLCMFWNLCLRYALVRIGVFLIPFLIVIEKVQSANNKEKMAIKATEAKKSSAPEDKSKPEGAAKNDVDVSAAKPDQLNEKLDESPKVDHVDQEQKHAAQAFPANGNEAEETESTIESTNLSSIAEESIAVPEAPGQPDNVLTIQELRDALARSNKTQTALADALDLSRFYVSKILSGAKPFTPELQAKCRQVLADWGVDLPES